MKVQSRSNTLGEAVSVSTDNIQKGNNLSLGEIPNVLLTDNLAEGEKITLKFDNLYYPYGDVVKYTVDYTFMNNQNIIETKEGINVRIGEENMLTEMDDVSIVTANISVSSNQHGTIALVGPKRMDYNKALAALEYLQEEINRFFIETDEEE